MTSEASYTVAVSSCEATNVAITPNNVMLQAQNSNKFHVGDYDYGIRYNGNCIWIDDSTYPYPGSPYDSTIVPWAVPDPPQVVPSKGVEWPQYESCAEAAWRVTAQSDRIILSIDVPGVDPNAIDLTISKGEVRLTAQRSDTNEHVVHSYAIGNVYDPSTTKAEVKHGVMTVTVMKRKRRKSRRIEVKDVNK